MPEHGVVRDRDGDIWVELPAGSGRYRLMTEQHPGTVGDTLAYVERNYGPLEYPRWVQADKAGPWCPECGGGYYQEYVASPGKPQFIPHDQSCIHQHYA